MDYKVVLTSRAKAHFREIIHYLRNELESQQAATSVTNRTIHFKRHKYLMVYSVHDNVAYVEGIYHDLQDYENVLK